MVAADMRSMIADPQSYSSAASGIRHGGAKLQLDGMLMFFGSFQAFSGCTGKSA